MKLGQQPQLSLAFSAGSQLSKLFDELSNVMSQPAKTSLSLVLTADSDKDPGGASSLQKSVLVNHLAVAAADVLAGAGSET
jgi:hypothetical protein